MSIFSKVSRSKLPSNVFNLSYSNKYTAKMGYLIPVDATEVVPGDIFMAGHGAFIRTQPMVSPVFANINYSVRYFFVPNRLIWDNFESFITDQEKGKKNLGSNHVHPYLSPIDTLVVESGSIYDYLGLPSGFTLDSKTSSLENVNALPWRAYNLIWNEYFKDENTMDDVTVNTADGADETEYELLKVSWRKDYFTSALPWAQRGDAVQLIGRVILDPSVLDERSQQWVKYGGALSDSDKIEFVNNGTLIPPVPGSTNMVSIPPDSDPEIANLDPNGTLNAAVEYSAIRKANAIQRFLERSALGGNRYAELLLAHFGTRSADASLQRPEYLGGGIMPINISPVEQNSQTSETSPQGTLAGKGVGIGSLSMNGRRIFREHGWLIAVAYIRPDAEYFQGIDRHLRKVDRFDYFWPDFQNIGEQEILNRELYASQDFDGTDFESFGYQSRYSEYKFKGNQLHGAFRDSELSSWVMPRRFEETPTLSKEFIELDLDTSPNFAVDEDVFPPFMVDSVNVIKARRPMYYFNRGTL